MGAESWLIEEKTKDNEMKQMRKKMAQKKKWMKRVILPAATFIVSLILMFFIVESGSNRGLLASYYNNISLEEPSVVEKIDEKIDFVWGRDAPYSNINGEFSVRWEGRLKIHKTDDYSFSILSDEGARLFLDDKIIINTWFNPTRLMENSNDIFLKKGFHKIKLEYYFNQKLADIKLLWSSSSFKRQIVANEFLYPPSGRNISR